eukprot:Plantae.Rhodophyta-Hildenbrandia_rubra.ctg8123.p3 GENE.Plantae.Rhodophyta-Hildenbrandia_rubra.ctg8123~~Plantae.Rhodophyta-Hildenbrandia_rubra.ctg8123.p3  ORF type:complete len:121 (-),score=23.47 Plantae.Rhodophyta-Hildenbrandia_rubra.ctg8123:1764-2126(-)
MRILKISRLGIMRIFAPLLPILELKAGALIGMAPVDLLLEGEWIAQGLAESKVIERAAREDLVKPHHDDDGSIINKSDITPKARDQPAPQRNADPRAALKRKSPGRRKGSKSKKKKLPAV